MFNDSLSESLFCVLILVRVDMLAASWMTLFGVRFEVWKPLDQ